MKCENDKLHKPFTKWWTTTKEHEIAVQVWQKVLFKEQTGIGGDQKGVAGSEMTGELVYDQEENRINNNEK